MPQSIVSESALLGMLRQINPWWQGKPVPRSELPRRDVITALWHQLSKAGAAGASIVTGPRRGGKTTVLYQVAQEILYGGVAPEQVVYIDFDHPVFRARGLADTLRAWSHVTFQEAASVYLLLDEVQYAPDWPGWLSERPGVPAKHQIVATQSCLPKKPKEGEDPEEAFRLVLPTLTFREYLGMRLGEPPQVSPVSSLKELLRWRVEDFERVTAQAEPLVAHFNEYLLRGGFPETATAPAVESAHVRMRESIIDQALKCDLTTIHGVRRVAELEGLLVHLCMNDAEVMDLQAVSRLLGISKNTLRSHLDLLSAAHIIHQLPQFGYGKEVLRGKVKVVLADHALAMAVMMRGRDAIEDADALAAAAEGCILKHLMGRYPLGGPAYSYWRGKPGEEVSVVVTGGTQSRPFMAHYRDGAISPDSLKGLRRFCEEKAVPLAYVATRNLADFGPLPLLSTRPGSHDELPARCLMIPALLLCYWMSEPVLPEEPKSLAGWFKGLRK